MKLQDYCLLGEEADKIFQNQDYEAAEAKYLDLMNIMERNGHRDIFVISKCVLGLILTYIKTKNFDKAFDIVTTDSSESLYGLGIMGLSQIYQTSDHDIMIYNLCVAFLCTLSDEKPDDIAFKISSYMKPVVKYSLEKEQEMTAIAISNWKQYLLYVYKDSVPEKYIEEISQFERSIHQEIPLMEIDFPLVSPWDIEMTRNHFFQT